MGKRPYAKPLGMNRASLRASFLDHTAIFLVDYLFVARSQVEQAGLYLSVKVGIKFPVLVGESFPVSDHYSNPTEPTRRRSFMRKESALRLMTWAWCKSRSSMAVATASSDMSSAHLENGLFEVRTIEPVS